MNNGFVHFAEFELQIIALAWLVVLYVIKVVQLSRLPMPPAELLLRQRARIKASKPKADQIRQTGAKIVVTSCDDCRHQITELSEHYNLGIKVTSLTELTVQALVIK